LVELLSARGQGIHVSELASVRLPFLSAEAAPFVLALSGLDARLRTTASDYVYLSAWEDPRRESPSEAVRNALLAAAVPLNSEQIRGAVELRIKRPYAPATISSCLQAIDAVYSEGLRTWSLPSAPDEDDEDDENEVRVDVAVPT